MSKLSSDNPDLMPVTDAVYHPPKYPRVAEAPVPDPIPGDALWLRISQSAMDGLADRFPKARRYAAQRRARGR